MVVQHQVHCIIASRDRKFRLQWENVWFHSGILISWCVLFISFDFFYELLNCVLNTLRLFCFFFLLRFWLNRVRNLVNRTSPQWNVRCEKNFSAFSHEFWLSHELKRWREKNWFREMVYCSMQFGIPSRHHQFLILANSFELLFFLLYIPCSFFHNIKP